MDARTGEATAIVNVYDDDDDENAEGLTFNGIEAMYQPSYSLIDTFVLTLQLGQVLLYELDQMARENSDTLWMRKTEFIMTGPPAAIGPLRAKVSLDRARILLSKGARWRVAEIVGQVGSQAQIRCNVAHQLPGQLTE